VRIQGITIEVSNPAVSKDFYEKAVTLVCGDAGAAEWCARR
jgi:hypothetical protein